jgi:plastocyanin
MHSSTRTRTRFLSLAVLAGVLLLGACGSDDGDASGNGNGNGNGNGIVRIDGVDIAFEPDDPAASAGAAVIEFRNTGSLAHNIVFRDVEGAPTASADDEFLEAGSERSFDVELTSGEFEFYCSVPGHEAAGMVGTLTVG